MIPAIGYMIGWYIIARAVEMMEMPKTLVRILSCLAGLVALLMMAVLFTSETTASPGLLPK